MSFNLFYLLKCLCLSCRVCDDSHDSEMKAENVFAVEAAAHPSSLPGVSPVPCRQLPPYWVLGALCVVRVGIVASCSCALSFLMWCVQTSVNTHVHLHSALNTNGSTACALYPT